MEEVRIDFPSATGAGSNEVVIQCLSELTPLDALEMSCGKSDPTGLCVWLGGFLFLELLVRKAEQENNPTRLQSYWSTIRRHLFPPGCTVCELGAGAGLVGIAMSIGGVCSDITLTDCNSDVLKLCKLNALQNRCSEVNIEHLEWGEGNASELGMGGTFDTVYATDVLYDLDSLEPLMVTASELLEERGRFILSHVPRASIDEGHDVGSDYWSSLESIILQKASMTGFEPASFPVCAESRSAREMLIAEMKNGSGDSPGGMILRPNLLFLVNQSGTDCLSKEHTWKRMQEAGAAVFVFDKI